jgi:tight adherence protein B
MLEIMIFLFVFSLVLLFFSQGFPLIAELLRKIQEKKVSRATKQLDTMFIDIKPEKLFLYNTVSPMALGLACFILTRNFIVTFAGMGLGLFLPTFIINTMKAQRKQRMQSQLVDALMILSSSLKGGLSLLQAIEVLVEESNPPLSQEFGWVLRENKMGVSLEESLKRLNERVEIEEVKLMTNSILVSRETGGDLTKVLSRLSTTIRDNRKLKDTIRTLTLQGRLQGLIMSVLPFFFVAAVISFNRNHFDIMFESEEGRKLIFLAIGMQTVGLILIQKFSRAKF